MKNSLWYRLITILMVLVLVVSLSVSCGKKETAREETTTPPTTEEETPPPTQTDESPVTPPEPSYEIVDPIMTDAGEISGTIVGEAGEEVRIYRGIPFAAPPVGELRWKPPEPVTPWTGVKACTEYALIAPQVTTSQVEQSEDCLYLNVYTPAKKTTDRLPVFVNIHGGAMVVGSSRTDLTYFTRQNDVVAVSIAYRLGGIGFLAHPLLSEESENGVSGNYGLMDQVAALEWVKNNIAAFGGDPDNVTIYGCSSGGESVIFLMASPFGKGLFHKAICDAGVYGSGRTPPLLEMEERGKKLVAKLGVSDAPGVLSAMRALSASEIVAAVPTGTSGTDLQLPNVDKWWLPDYPLNIFQAGKQQNVPLMIGSGSSDLSGAWNQYFDKTIASAMSTVSAPVYAWVFDHATCGKGGGTHCLSTAYLFADLSKREGMCDVDFKVSEVMVAMWIQFARTGNPNVPGLIEWPVYRADADRYLKIGEPLEIKTGLFTPPPAGAVATGQTTYTNSDYGFSLQYPGNWTAKTGDLGPSVVWRVGSGTYFIPSVRLIVRDQSEGTDLQAVFTAHLTADGGKTIDSFTASEVTINGTNFTQADVTYTGTSGKYESRIIGLVKNGKWIIIEVYTIPSLFPFASATQKADIINTVTFQ
ncbi:MAG TPA: carboxylesterase family protein [Dehalococcoidales bacterium]